MTNSRLRVANVHFLNSTVYRVLQQEHWLDYQETSPAEAGRLLLEGECDLALIPAAEYLLHGGYALLPFGVIGSAQMEGAMLCATRPFEEISVIYADSTARTATMLLRVLLKRCYPEVARRVRLRSLPGDEILDHVRDDAGGLFIGDLALRARPRFAHRFDLTKVWAEHTQLPFVLSVWAARPNALPENTTKRLEDVLQRSLAHLEFYARDWADLVGVDRDYAVQFVTERIRYRLDEDAMKALEHFAQLASDLQLLPPPAPARRPTANAEARRCCEEILDEVSAGKRISDADAALLASRAALADLMLAASLRTSAMKTLHPLPSPAALEIALSPDDDHGTGAGDRSSLLPKEEVLKRLSALRKQPGTILLRTPPHLEVSPAYYEELLPLLRAHSPARLCAIHPAELPFLARLLHCSVEECLRRLRQAGLDMLNGANDALLLSRWAGTGVAESRLAALRSAHISGSTALCSLPLRPKATWEDRIVHLHKIRQLNDETGMMCSLLVEAAEPPSHLYEAQHTSSNFLRAVALSRLYLDNAPHIFASAKSFGTPIAELALECGAAVSVIQA